MNKKNIYWAEEVQEYSLRLHKSLTIDNNEWHKSKSNKEKRAAELLSAAILQLISKNGEDSYVIDLAEQAIKFLKGEIKDTGCPDK